MCDASVLPFDYSDLVIEELQGEFIDNMKISISKGSKEGDNYVGNLLRIKLNSKQDESRSLSLMLKQPPSDKKSLTVLPINELYGREADVYNIILPGFDALQREFNIRDTFYHAKCYKATKEIILMEDLAESGFHIQKCFNFFDIDHLRMIVVKLAQFHSYSFAMKEHHPQTFQKFSEHMSLICIGEYLQSVMEIGAVRAMSIIDDSLIRGKLEEFSKNIVEKYYLLCSASISEPYNVICHGDCWNNNILFKYEEGLPVDLRMVDWQTSKCCSPIIDIAFTIFSCTDSSTRDEHYPKILDIYYDALGESLIKLNCSVEKCYPRNAFNDHVQKLLPYGLLKCMIFLPLIIPEKGGDRQLSEMEENDTQFGKMCKNAIIVLFPLNAQCSISFYLSDYMKVYTSATLMSEIGLIIIFQQMRNYKWCVD
ncbi:uncharacterized protein LOC143914726 [Arctopsyche grandis]|uniref:uncharacterized protein LOC143914726 n=1 Tax=Arctopsyche grandis TaxID=121162 RepID=UPI00406D976F